MDTIRAVIRLLVIVIVTLIYLIFFSLALPILIFLPGQRISWRGLWMNVWGWTIARVIGMRVHVSGQPPAPPFCLVSNHLGYIDVVTLMANMRCIFVAKAEVNQWPVLGWLARNFGTMFINRRRKKDVVRINREIHDALEKGNGVVFFPEGTSSRGEHVLPFKASLLDIPARSGYPVAYAAIRYETPPGEDQAAYKVCWWGDMTFGDHLFDMLKLRRFYAYLTFGEQTIRSDNRKVLARQLEERVNILFKPTYVSLD